MAKAIKAKHGEKTIEVRIKFWTNNIAPNQGEIIQKTAWESGMVVMERNHLHEIKPKKPQPFHSMADLIGKIEKVLIAHDITLRHGNRSKKLFS